MGIFAFKGEAMAFVSYNKRVASIGHFSMWCSSVFLPFSLGQKARLVPHTHPVDQREISDSSVLTESLALHQSFHAFLQIPPISQKQTSFLIIIFLKVGVAIKCMMQESLMESRCVCVCV